MPASVYDPVPDIGYLYDHVPLYLGRSDVPLYVDEARRAGGPVLEIGCGTGRILLPTARAGFEITGIDGSRLMLERLHAKLAGQSAEVRGRITVVENDARNYDLGRQFALVTAPFRVFQHMETVEDQLAFLGSALRHLAPGGRFVFDVYNPNFSFMVGDRTALSIDTPMITLPDGRSMERGWRLRKVNWLNQLNEVDMVWRVSDGSGGAVHEYVQPFDMRWFTRSEMEHLLARAGFRVEAVYGDLDRGPLVEGAPEMIWVLSRA